MYQILNLICENCLSTIYQGGETGAKLSIVLATSSINHTPKKGSSRTPVTFPAFNPPCAKSDIIWLTQVRRHIRTILQVQPT